VQLDHDPMGSEETSASGLSGFAAELIDGEDDESKTPPREGLPARFRMRHTPHYVDELLGDAPLRTVREIPVAEIESPIDDRAEIDDLERSIRRLGVIEPLLVGLYGAQYRVIAGMRRLRAAQRIGLDTVPCLVHDVRDVDEARLLDMRDAAAQRFAIPPSAPPDVEEVTAPTGSAEPEFRAEEPTIGEAALGLKFVSALLPAMNAAGNDRLRWGVLTDLAAVEVARAKTIEMAHDACRSARPIDRASVDYVALVNHVVSAVATEARLRGVRVDLSAQESNPAIFIDGGRCREALTGLLQCLLALAPRAGTVLAVSALITSIRPALIVECLLHESDSQLSPEAFARFFEAGWREHPCGVDGSAILAMLALTARAHGGRVDVKPAASGCLVTFVVPKLDG
jgi:ParB-like nuclease domain